jgi:hypothetical protein
MVGAAIEHGAVKHCLGIASSTSGIRCIRVSCKVIVPLVVLRDMPPVPALSASELEATTLPIAIVWTPDALLPIWIPCAVLELPIAIAAAAVPASIVTVVPD